MSYITLEYLTCVVAVLGFATLVFASSLIVMLVRDGFAYVFRAARSVSCPTSQVSSTFGSCDLRESRSPGIALDSLRP
jgi:hypothetical protein